jgi:hypothetical protein
VRFYNGFIKSFPHNIAAAIMGIKNLPYLQADEMAEMKGEFPGN